MHNSIELFNFQGQELTVFEIEGELWFIGKEVATLLGYERTNDAISQHCKKASPISSFSNTVNYRVLKLDPRTALIPEPDLYRLIAKCTLPIAERFEEWLYEEVLPSIRKNGSYSIKPQLPQNLKHLAEQYKGALELAEIFFTDRNQAMLSANRTVKKVADVDVLELMEVNLVSEKQEHTFTPTELGNKIDKSGIKVNKMIEALKLQEKDHYKEGKWRWQLTEKGKEYGVYMDTGKKHSDGTPIKQIKWAESILELLT